MALLLKLRHILLADDDKDDQLLFKEALEELTLSTHLSVVQNGELLMQKLNDEKEQLPDILFLTSYEPEIVNLFYKKGAQYYIRKPNDFEQLKKVIYHCLILTGQKDISQPSRKNFVLSPLLINDEAR